MKNESLLIEFAKFIGKDESDVKAFEQHLISKSDKTFSIVTRFHNDVNEYGIVSTINSEFYYDKSIPHFITDTTKFMNQVNHMISLGYKLV